MIGNTLTRIDRRTAFAARLRTLRRQCRLRVLMSGGVRILAIAGGASLAAVWAVGAGPEPYGILSWGLTVSLLAVWAVAVRDLWLRPWRRIRSLAETARRVEDRGGFDNLAVAAEEALRRPDRWSEADAIGKELNRRLFDRAASLLATVSSAEVVPLRHAGLWRGAALAVVVLVGVYLSLAPGEFRTGVMRVATPWPTTTVVPTGGLYGLEGPRFVVAGDNVTLEALDFASGTENTVCEVLVGNGLWQPVAATVSLDPEFGPIPPAPYRRWTASVGDVREDFSWRFRRGSRVSEPQRLIVRSHPLVTRLAARIVPPSYTRVPPLDLDRLPTRFEVPAGSRMHIQGRTNHPVASARLVVVDGDTLDAVIDSLAFEATLEVAESLTFHPDVVDAWGLKSPTPLRYEVVATPDEVPLVELRRQADDGILPLAGELVLEVTAGDDFGLDEIRLLVRTADSPVTDRADGLEDLWQGGAVWPGPADRWRSWSVAAGALTAKFQRLDAGGSDLRLRLRVDVRTEDLGLVPGDVLEIVAEAVDNKEPPPAGRGRSHVLRLMLPAAGDVLDLQAEAATEHRSDLEEMRRRGTDLEADLDRLTRELMKNPLPDWARQQEMENAIERQRKLQEELSRVAAELQQEMENLARGQLTSERQLAKADELNELLSPESSERLQDLLAKLEQSSGQVSPDEVARVMDEVTKNQKEMARRLDAALKMMQRMAQEQELEGLTALVEQMMRRQQELADASRELAEAEQDGEAESGSELPAPEQADPTEDGTPSEDAAADAESASPEELARRQEALARELEQLQEKLAEALEKMRDQAESDPAAPEHQKELAEALQDAMDKMQKQQSSETMDDASESLENMDPGQAAEMQEQALRDLGALYHVMLETQQAMQMAMQMNQVTSLRGLAADLLAVSSRQEEIAARIPARIRDLRTGDLTRSQHRLQKATVAVRENLAELTDEAPDRILKLLKKIDGLVEEMGASLRAMEEGRGQVARRHSRESLAASNRLVIGLLTEARMAGGQGGGSGSKPSASEQLQEMIKRQAELNGNTEELRRMLADRGISQETRSQMQRLGEQQAELADEMGRMAEQRMSGQGSGSSGESGSEPGPDGDGDGPESAPERIRPDGDPLLGDLTQLGRDMETVGKDIEDGLVAEETLRRQERILGRMLDARNSVRERDYSNRRESRTAGRLYGDQAGREGPESAEDRVRSRRYQPLEKAPLEYRDLVRRYFAALDSLRQDAPLVEFEPADPEGGAP